MPRLSEFSIETGLPVVGFLSKRVLRLVRTWAKEHQEELEENWKRVRKHEEPKQIKPLQ